MKNQHQSDNPEPSVESEWLRWVDGRSIELKADHSRFPPNTLEFQAIKRYLAKSPHYVATKENDDPNLFLRFAEVAPTESAILKFANKWGLLGEVAWILVEPKKDYAEAESLDFWQHQIAEMKQAVEWWDVIGRDPSVEINLNVESILAGDEMDPKLQAKMRLWSKLQSKLQQHCSPVIVRINDTFEITTEPNNLLGKLWQQFTHRFIGLVRLCKVCGKEMKIEKGKEGAYRAGAFFCSPACQQKDHRRKVKEAKELRAEGKTVKQIAKHFDTSNEVIQNWLAKKK